MQLEIYIFHSKNFENEKYLKKKKDHCIFTLFSFDHI